MKSLIYLAVTASLIATAASAAEPTTAKQPSPPPAAADRVPDTVMFSIDEVNEIQSRAAANVQEKDGKKESDDAIESAKLYLSTILYYGPNDWTIWVNGIAIGPRQEFQSFQITDIKPNYVELTVPLSALGMRPVKLAPNQTFIVASGTVVEGPWR